MKKVLRNIIVLILSMIMLSVVAFAGDYTSETELTFGATDVYNFHTYAVYYGAITWEEAQAWCEANGGHLATITDENEQRFIEELNCDYANLWIGAYRETFNNWKWVTGEAWSYTHWAEGEPNDSNNVVPDENCVVLWPSEWNDLNSQNIYEQYGFICEWESEDIVPPKADEPEEYYFRVYLDEEIVLNEGDVCEIFVDTNSPLEMPCEIISSDERVIVIEGSCILAVGEGEAELLIYDYYGGFTYSYMVYVQGMNDNGENKDDNEGAGVGEYNAHTYAIYRCSVNWETAKAWCEANGGHLATITDENEQRFIEELNCDYANLWIGAYRETFNDWKWVTGEAWDYAAWAEGEPNDSDNVVPDENCVALWPVAWNDLNSQNIYEQQGFVCEWDYVKNDVPKEAPKDELPSEDDNGGLEEKPDDVIETKPAREVEMTITTTIKEPENPEEEAEVIMHIELEELTGGDVEDTKVFVRATTADGNESIQSFGGRASLEVGVPLSKRRVKVFCFESMTTLKPLCEAKIIEIDY